MFRADVRFTLWVGGFYFPEYTHALVHTLQVQVQVVITFTHVTGTNDMTLVHDFVNGSADR